MLKHKIISIIMGTLMLSGVMIGANSINNAKTINDNTKVVNKVLLSAPTSTNERAVVVNTDNSPLVLYSSASASSNITSYISVGEMLTIQASGNNFYKVRVQETGAVGYISVHNLQIITSGVNDPYKDINKEGYIINVSSRVNLRANATMNSNILNKLTNNTKINILGKQGEWYKVNYNGTVGYIYQEYIGIANTGENTVPTSKVKVQNSNKYKLVNITIPYGEGLKISIKPNLNSKVVTTLLSGNHKVEIINQANGWSYIKVNNVYGYVVTYSLNAAINDFNNHLNSNSGSNGVIKLIKPIPNKIFGINTIIVENTTGQDISNSQLSSVMRYWILTGQDGCFGVCDADGTMWSKQWFNTVSNSELVKAFIEANGTEALSQNITANELKKAAMRLTRIVPAVPFTLQQATKNIQEMLNEYGQHQKITKVVFHGNDKEGGLYYVYTSYFGNKRPYWYVYSNIGYATGI